jgi:FixJ family two-component response regulator
MFIYLTRSLRNEHLTGSFCSIDVSRQNCARLKSKDCALDRNLVLVVDDDPGILRGLKRLLRQYGYESRLFQTAQAFNKNRDFAGAICIVLDIQLDGESGIEVRHRLVEAGISLPVIYITANDNPAIRAAALESGCIAYLTKPFPAKSLIEPIEKAAAGFA